eukprot:4454188-Prymnesium_polylepis.1
MNWCAPHVHDPGPGAPTDPQFDSDNTSQHSLFTHASQQKRERRGIDPVPVLVSRARTQRARINKLPSKAPLSLHPCHGRTRRAGAACAALLGHGTVAGQLAPKGAREACVPRRPQRRRLGSCAARRRVCRAAPTARAGVARR